MTLNKTDVLIPRSMWNVTSNIFDWILNVMKKEKIKPLYAKACNLWLIWTCLLYVSAQCAIYLQTTVTMTYLNSGKTVTSGSWF